KITESPKQKVVGPAAETTGVGSGFTAVEMLFEVSEQPNELVAITDQESAEETVSDESVEPIKSVSFRNHWYETPPVTDKITESPKQKVVGPAAETTGVGSGFTAVEMVF